LLVFTRKEMVLSEESLVKIGPFQNIWGVLTEAKNSRVNNGGVLIDSVHSTLNVRFYQTVRFTYGKTLYGYECICFPAVGASVHITTVCWILYRVVSFVCFEVSKEHTVSLFRWMNWVR
jgi:hypothetical protein